MQLPCIQQVQRNRPGDRTIYLHVYLSANSPYPHVFYICFFPRELLGYMILLPCVPCGHMFPEAMRSRWPGVLSGHVFPVAVCPMWPCVPCGHVFPVAMCSLWPSVPSGHVFLVAMCSLWPCVPCGSVSPVNMYSLWKCVSCGQVYPMGRCSLYFAQHMFFLHQSSGAPVQVCAIPVRQSHDRLLDSQLNNTSATAENYNIQKRRIYIKYVCTIFFYVSLVNFESSLNYLLFCPFLNQTEHCMHQQVQVKARSQRIEAKDSDAEYLRLDQRSDDY